MSEYNIITKKFLPMGLRGMLRIKTDEKFVFLTVGMETFGKWDAETTIMFPKTSLEQVISTLHLIYKEFKESNNTENNKEKEK